MKVLLVEDDEMCIMLMQKMLSNCNASVSIAKNGLIALEKIKKDSYNLVLMDIQMPVMDGLTATKGLRKFDKTVPVIVMASDRNPGIKSEFNGLNILDFMYKPVSQDALTRAIQLSARASR